MKKSLNKKSVYVSLPTQLMILLNPALPSTLCLVLMVIWYNKVLYNSYSLKLLFRLGSML